MQNLWGIWAMANILNRRWWYEVCTFLKDRKQFISNVSKIKIFMQKLWALWAKAKTVGCKRANGLMCWIVADNISFLKFFTPRQTRNKVIVEKFSYFLPTRQGSFSACKGEAWVGELSLDCATIVYSKAQAQATVRQSPRKTRNHSTSSRTQLRNNIDYRKGA